MEKITLLTGPYSLGGYKFFRNESSTIAGGPAWRLDYASEFQGTTYYVVEYYLVKDGRLFTLSYDDDDALDVPQTFPIAQKMIDSLQFTKLREESQSLLINTTKTNSSTSVLTYKTSEDSFRINYPANYSVLSNGQELDRNAIVEIRSPDKATALSIYVSNVTKYLDTNDMKVKTNSLNDYVQKGISSLSPGKKPLSHSAILPIFRYEYLRNNPVNLGMDKNNPSWKIEYNTYLLGDTRNPVLAYGATIFTIKNNKLYEIDYRIYPLNVPKSLPVIQKMLDSFQIIK